MENYKAHLFDRESQKGEHKIIFLFFWSHTGIRAFGFLFIK